jgi:ammonia channel protein AmtB
VKFVLAFVLLIAVFAAAITAGVVVFEPGLEETRDRVIVVYGSMGIFLLVALIFVLVFIAIAIRSLTGTLTRLLDDPVRPALEDVRDTARNVRGATEFVADTAVHPVIRLVSMVRGVRRGVAVLTGLRRR